MHYDYLIVGAGLFGATFAEQATKAGKKCLVIDRRPHIGGNVYTKNVEGINVHVYGAHIFHTSIEKVWEYVNRFTSFNNYVNRVIANYNGELYSLPFNMYTFNKLWGANTEKEARKCIEDQIKNRKLNPEANLEEHAISMVGVDIYEKLIKGYTEKQWGQPCNKLPASIIKRLPIRFTYDDNYFNDKYQGIPIGGYTQMVEKMLLGIEVKLNTEYKNFIENTSDTFEKIVYTGMVDELFNYELGHLAYRSLRFETEILDVEDYQENAVINYTSSNEKYTRIIEHKHFEFTKCPKTIISREYPDTYEVGKEAYYTVNNEENTKLYSRYQELTYKKLPNVILGGRLGEYKYYDMDKVIASALELAERELDK